MDTKLGTFFNAFVQSGQVVFEGESFKRPAPKSILRKKALYTPVTAASSLVFFGFKNRSRNWWYACDNSLPILDLGLSRVDSPRLVIPLKSTRQSGLLVPTIQLGSASGLSVGLPYFWPSLEAQI